MITLNKDRLNVLLRSTRGQQTVKLLGVYDEKPRILRSRDSATLNMRTQFLEHLMERPTHTSVKEYNVETAPGEYMRRIALAQRVSESFAISFALWNLFPEGEVGAAIERCLKRLDLLADEYEINGFACEPLLIALPFSPLDVKCFVVYTPHLINSEGALASGLAQPLEMASPAEMASAALLLKGPIA